MKLTRNRSKPILFKSLSQPTIIKPTSILTSNNMTKASFRNAPPLTKLTKGKKDFNFLFKDDITSLNINTNPSDIIRKLNNWDRDHLNTNINPSSNRIEQIIELKRKKVITQSVIDQGQFLKTHRKNATFKMKDLFDCKGKDKEQLRYTPKTSFDYTPFINPNMFNSKSNLNKEQEETQSQKTVDTINNELVEGTYYYQYVFQKKKKESMNRNQLMLSYKKIMIYNFKKEKCEGILEDIYQLLEEAREEKSMLNNILKVKIKKNGANYKQAVTQLIELQQQSKTPMKKTNQPNTNINQPITTRAIDDKGKDKDSSDDLSHISNETVTITLTSKREMNNTIMNQRKSHLHKSPIQGKLRLYIDYVAISKEFKEEIKENNNRFEEIKEELTQLINQNKAVLSEINKALLFLRTQYESQIKKQKEYYISLLKQGIDTRNEGLTWIVKRLLEINISPDSSNFPNYLDTDQINYLMKRSTLENESIKLHSLLKTIKIRKQTLINEDNFKRLREFASIPIAYRVTNNILELQSNDSALKLRKYMNSKFKSIYSKYNAIGKQGQDQIMEDVQIQHIIRTIKDRISEYALDSKSMFDNNIEEVKEYIEKHESHKEYYEDIKALRKRLDDIEIELKELNGNEAEMFRRKYHFMKTRLEGDKANAYYENVYNALFGTRMLKQ